MDMPHFEDLSPCTYFFEDPQVSRLLAVGWLDAGRSYPRGATPPAVTAHLRALSAQPWIPFAFLTMNYCPFCVPAKGAPETVPSSWTGTIYYFIPGDGVVYVAPELILHSIDAHGYRPPEPFCQAVLRCPPMWTREYFTLIAANGPVTLAGRIQMPEPAI